MIQRDLNSTCKNRDPYIMTSQVRKIFNLSKILMGIKTVERYFKIRIAKQNRHHKLRTAELNVQINVNLMHEKEEYVTN
jgi:hypothetical protein